MKTLSHRFYLFYAGFIAVAAAWAIAQFFHWLPNIFSLCLFKSITGLACPGCGTTRAGLALLDGNILAALETNPVGIITTIVLAVSALLFSYDVFTGEKVLLTTAQKAERALKNPRVLISALTLILMNWSWSIVKGL
jgi:Protein of unknown function (DUF2752)